MRHRLPLDVTHLSERSLADLWELLDALDPERALPGARQPHRGADETASSTRSPPTPSGGSPPRDGIIGLISADHQLQPDRPPRSLAETAALLAEHVRAIEHLAGAGRYAALGTDLGGFVTPAAGLENAGRLGALRQALVAELDDEELTATAEGNALRFLRRALA